MKNYAEEIAYWYFRLNGFFLLENYVSHMTETGSSSYADSDLIGIRTRHVSEVIGLNDADSDSCPVLQGLIGKLGETTVGLICEVKGGATQTMSLNADRIESCVKRMGLLEREKVGEAVDKLKTCIYYKDDGRNIAVHKVLASASDSSVKGWSPISLKVMRDFIVQRIAKYVEKRGAWNHYASPVLQYLLYEARGGGVR